jgi:peptidyl-prolyl cis-trans isomerase B (cyclophilin B)
MILAWIAALAAPDLVHAEWRRDREAVLAARDTVEPARALTALGRLRDPATLPELERGLAASDPETAVAAARALGWTPGGGPVALRALRQRAVPTDPIAARSAEFGLHWQLIEAVGRQGDARALSTLAAHLTSPWPFDAAAARAILRLHRNGVDVTGRIGDLVAAVRRPDVRSQQAVSQALARIGLVHPRPAEVQAVALAATTAPLPALRRDLLQAVADHLRDTQRRTVLHQALADLPLVRAMALDLVGPTDDATEQVVASLTHADWRVRRAAITAAGRLALDEPLRALLDGAELDPFARGQVLAALGGVAPPDAPWPVRAAVVDQEDDAVLRTLAGSADAAPGLRSAAMAALLERNPTPSMLLPLLAAPDPRIREAAVASLADHPSRDLAEELVLGLRVERDAGTVAALLVTLLDWAPRGVVVRSRFLDSALRREARNRTPRIRDAARALAAALGTPVDATPDPPVTRELILPDGTVTTTTGDLPDPAEVRRYTEAVLVTSAGEVTIALDPATAPLAVYQFVTLARSGFYDGLVWHRTVPGFVAQTGCPRGDGWGGPGWTIVDEVSDRPFTTGAVGMARSERDTAGSQFFVMTGAARFLDGDYTRFGRVTDGMEAIHALARGAALERVLVRMEQP